MMSDANCGTCPSSSPITEVLEVPMEPPEVTITPKALGMLKQAIDGGDSSLLIGVLDGGCSGFMYDLQLIENSDQSCQSVLVDGINVLIPDNVSNMLQGIEIDYTDKLMGGGFKINNPNAQRTCGCGESFR